MATYLRPTVVEGFIVIDPRVPWQIALVAALMVLSFEEIAASHGQDRICHRCIAQHQLAMVVDAFPIDGAC